MDTTKILADLKKRPGFTENVGMVLGLMPVTGIPLPFISYGGSNLLTNYMGMGLVFGIAMRSRERRRRGRHRPAARL